MNTNSGAGSVAAWVDGNGLRVTSTCDGMPHHVEPVCAGPHTGEAWNAPGQVQRLAVVVQPTDDELLHVTEPLGFLRRQDGCPARQWDLRHGTTGDDAQHPFSPLGQAPLGALVLTNLDPSSRLHRPHGMATVKRNGGQRLVRTPGKALRSRVNGHPCSNRHRHCDGMYLGGQQQVRRLSRNEVAQRHAATSAARLQDAKCRPMV